MRSRPLRTPAVLGATAITGVLGAATPAHAESYIQQPGEHPHYAIEVEPKLDFTLFGYGGVGLGIGGRVSIPLTENGFIPSLNNNVAIGFGVDVVHYGCSGFGNYSCSSNFLYVPVVLQWNFFVAPQWSVFGEPGIALFHDFYSSDYVALSGYGTSVAPVFNVGARYHFGEHVALTLRVGFPSFSAGVSFM